MSKKFEKRESYTHLYAKKLLAEWLHKGFNIQIDNRSFPISAGNHFTHLEYPITDCYPNYIDECGCTNWGNGEHGKCDYRCPEIIESPCLKCKYLEGKFIAVADIATAHKGWISDVFEIINKNEEIDEKVELYSSIGQNCAYFIDAKHILGQISPPNILHGIAAVRWKEIYYDD